jgi:DNA primase small subunit
MPHSVASNDSSPRDNGDGEILPDAPTLDNNEASEEQKTETNVKLEDLFADDDDDDDEFPASSAADVKMRSSPPVAPTPAPYARTFNLFIEC